MIFPAIKNNFPYLKNNFIQFRFRAGLYLSLALLFSFTVSAEAYIGPGAGFAFLYSFFVIFLIIFIAPLFLLIWPVWYVIHQLKIGGGPKNPRAKRVVVLGLDGLDPQLSEKYLREGRLPNFRKLAESGSFHKLATTHPSVSPVAWSTFQTGVNPCKHNIFDFLDRDLNNYTPKLSSAYIGGASGVRKIGPFKLPKGKSVVRLLRKSQPFWTILGKSGVFSTVLRVPITFPPEKFYGLSLSAMCVPDLKGTQGTFTYYHTASGGHPEEAAGGFRIPVKWENDRIDTYIPGPTNALAEPPQEMRLPLKIVRKNGGVDLKLNGNTHHLALGEYTPWIKVEFRAGAMMKAAGICRFCLSQVEPELGLYLSPLNIDPEKPALPISHPVYYSVYLAKLQGAYATLGLAEDTWALNEGAISDQAFLEQAWNNHREREQMFFHALQMNRQGLVVCVFDTSDRIQHMFWRHLEKNHPANLGQTVPSGETAIETMYRRMDELVGKTMEKIGKDDVLMVISDHGFKSFRRCFSINAWLKANGYLTLKPGAAGGDYFAEVDWTKTRAYGVGLGGFYINLRGREKQGIVEKGADYDSLIRELKAKLIGLKDPVTGEEAIHKLLHISETGSGPYMQNAPDLLFGFNPGCRIAWNSVTGDTTGEIFTDNIKKWSGDHCIDPEQAPGIFFSNGKITLNDPHLKDISAATLDLLGVPIPAYIEGRPLFR